MLISGVDAQQWYIKTIDTIKKRGGRWDPVFEPVWNGRLLNLNAWLLFLGSDDPVDIIRLIERYPEFKAMYQQIYEMCENVEDMMSLFSKELAMMDENTVTYMMDEMQAEIDQQKIEIDQQKDELERKNDELKMTHSELERQREEIEALKRLVAQLTEEKGSAENRWAVGGIAVLCWTKIDK